ncbi:HlyD family efflux transporter periplasmic adaptor subunit [Candidatus Peregrinibacteria bacterium]|nr:HlyD family efflux transporter periplasmic adaptor subunit [Candidatus Peregrinibacteria bacterium]
MKFLRYLLYFIIIAGIIAAGIAFFTSNNGVETNENEQNQVQADERPVKVTTVTPEQVEKFYIDALGTVQSKIQAEIMPSTSGIVSEILISPGQQVNEGQILFRLKGNNNTSHPSERQLQIALENLNQAQINYDSTVANNQVAAQVSELELQSAINQAEAASLNVQQINQNIQGVRDTIQILNDSLENTIEKNTTTLAKSRSDIDDLIIQINELQDQKRGILIDIDELDDEFDDTENPEKQAMLNQAIQSKQEQIQSLNSTLDELYKNIENARFGYETTLDNLKIGDNQLISQIQQQENQLEVLELNRLSTIESLGLEENTTNALELAKQGYQTKQIQRKTSLAQAESQLEIAKMNYQTAQDNADSLLVKATTSGIIGNVNVETGDSVSPQNVMAEIISAKSFQLEVGVDIQAAEGIIPGSTAEIAIADRSVEAPILSVSPIADKQTKLVNVIIDLPPVFFRNNQTMEVRLPIRSDITSEAFFIPLDAVTIGTEESSVFVREGSVAKRVVVELGEVYGDQVEILSGLTAEREIIVRNAKYLTDGQAIEISKN